MEFILIGPSDLCDNFRQQSFYEKHGAKHEEIIGKKCYAVTHKLESVCSLPDHDCPLQDTLNSKSPATVIHHHYDVKGNRYSAEVFTAPVFGKDGEITAVTHMIKDVSKQQEQMLYLEQQAPWGSWPAVSAMK